MTTDSTINTTPTGGSEGGLLFRVNPEFGADNEMFFSILNHLYEWVVRITLRDGTTLEGAINGTPWPGNTGLRPRCATVATEDADGRAWGSLTAWDEERCDHVGPVIPFCWDDVIVLEIQ